LTLAKLFDIGVGSGGLVCFDGLDLALSEEPTPMSKSFAG